MKVNLPLSDLYDDDDDDDSTQAHTWPRRRSRGCGCGVQTAFGQTTTAPQCEFCCPGLSSIFTLQFSLCVYCICLMISWTGQGREQEANASRKKKTRVGLHGEPEEGAQLVADCYILEWVA